MEIIAVTTRKKKANKTAKLTASQRKQAKELYLNSNMSIQRVARTLGLSVQQVTSTASRQRWHLLRTMLTGNIEAPGLITLLLQAEIEILITDLKLFSSYAQRFASIICSKSSSLSLSALTQSKDEYENSTKRVRRLANKLAGLNILESICSRDNVNDNMETVHVALKLAPALRQALALARAGNAGIMNTELGTFSKAPKANLGDIDTAESVDKSETKPTKASNRVYKPMRRN